jgi:hypothetical protein
MGAVALVCEWVCVVEQRADEQSTLCHPAMHADATTTAMQCSSCCVWSVNTREVIQGPGCLRRCERTQGLELLCSYWWWGGKAWHVSSIINGRDDVSAKKQRRWRQQVRPLLRSPPCRGAGAQAASVSTYARRLPRETSIYAHAAATLLQIIHFLRPVVEV